VNTEALRYLEAEGVKVRPSSQIIELVQDKGAQKQFYTQKGFPTAPFTLSHCATETIPKLQDTLPAVVKLRRMGYDGKGVQIVRTTADFDKVFDAPVVIENMVSLQAEVAIIVARNPAGDIQCYPAVQMDFHPEANLVERLFCPANLPLSILKECEEIAKGIAIELGLEGILAVELFVDTAGRVLVNEIAPRPHNSGHHTIEANVTSQYEQHLRAVICLPLGSAALVRPAVMLNILGAEGYAGTPYYAGIETALKLPGVRLHLYGKHQTRPFRKMGHLTITANTLETAFAIADQAQKMIQVIVD
jgi:5-(carboxyamino)imidazole ribonucleotide synthase